MVHNTYCLDALSASLTDIDTEDAVIAPLALARKAIQPHHVTQSRLDRPTLKVNPVDRGRAII